MIKHDEYDRDKAIKAFEISRYKELEEIISHADTDKMSAEEIVQLIAFRALVEQKLHKIYWSDEVAQLAILALEKSDIRECRDLEAKLLLNEVQIIIRNKKDDKRFNRAMELLSLADDCFARQGNKLESLFVKDEKLRTYFEFLRNRGRTEEINQIVEEYIILDSRFDKFRGEKAETWQLNSEFHSLRVMAYANYPYAKILGRKVVEKFNSRGNKLKALAARIYTLCRVGFCINEFLARIRGE
jgi:hypothetical protein